MRKDKIKLSELMAEYESALTKYGLGYATRLRLLQRAAAIVRKHERQGNEYFDGGIVSEYFRGIDNRFYNGEITKDYSRVIYREAERLLWFAKTGEVKPSNPQQGARQALTPKYELIAEEYLSLEMHPNTRNDARWITHKYFAWLEENGCADLTGVGSAHIQKFLLECSAKMSMNSIRDVRLHLIKGILFMLNAVIKVTDAFRYFAFADRKETLGKPQFVF